MNDSALVASVRIPFGYALLDVTYSIDYRHCLLWYSITFSPAMAILLVTDRLLPPPLQNIMSSRRHLLDIVWLGYANKILEIF